MPKHLLFKQTTNLGQSSNKLVQWYNAFITLRKIYHPRKDLSPSERFIHWVDGVYG